MFPRAAQKWLNENWPFAGLTAGLFLLAIVPLLWRTWPLSELVIFLQIPVYMAHQLEEHYHDRFRTFVNFNMAHGHDALTPEAVVVINVVGVWFLDLLSLFLAVFVHSSLGLIAMYLALVNAFVHAVGYVVMRRYNPGLVTAILLLVPSGCAGLWVLVHTAPCSLTDHLFCIGVVVVLHLWTILHIRARAKKLQSSGPVHEPIAPWRT